MNKKVKSGMLMFIINWVGAGICIFQFIAENRQSTLALFAATFIVIGLYTRAHRTKTS